MQRRLNKYHKFRKQGTYKDKNLYRNRLIPAVYSKMLYATEIKMDDLECSTSVRYVM